MDIAVAALRTSCRRRLAYGWLVALALGAGACSPAAGSPNASDGPRSTTPSGSAISASSAPPAPVASVTITPTADQQANPKVPVVVTVAKGTLTSVTVTNPTGTVVKGGLSADKTTWTSNEPLGYGVAYQVAVDALGSDGQSVHQAGTVQTLTPKAQTFPSMTPGPKMTDVGVGQPIVITFDKAVTDRAAAEKALVVTSSPPQQGGWYWLSKTELHYRPKVYWQPGTTVAVNMALYGVDLGGGVYGKTDRQLTFHVHDSWIAKADGKSDQMQVLHNGQLVKTLSISLGSPQNPSHIGPHVVSDKQPQVVMDSCTYGVCQGQPGYYKETVFHDVRISNDGEFVHAAPWSVGQQGQDNVSHGCINLSNENAQWFYNTFNLGDVVEITNSGGPPLPLWDTYGDWELSWDQWFKGSAL
jgi:lipoprotein-anchoring transpeptidase ErfK/SrfK